jgi:Rad3-related DNA helicase
VRDLTTIPVRLLAEFVHRRGDLFEPGGRVTAEEGIRGQAGLQKRRGENYRREVLCEGEISLDGANIKLRGRADGVDAQAGLVEEIKASRHWPEVPFPEHRAQALLYAGLLDRAGAAHTEWQIQVTYVDPDTLETRIFTEVIDAADLRQFLDQSVRAWIEWSRRRLEVRSRRDAWIRTLTFPMPELRPWQGAIMRRTAKAIRRREPLLLEAPTGSGKTLAVTWPAVRALPEASRVFFLTSRTTGSRAALQAFRQIDGTENRLSRIVLTAREKICPLPGTPCDPELCPNARGYYDRSGAAVTALLEHPEATADVVSAVAQAHQVCPFELSLDASLWFDVVIGDYNYVFDPVVRLRRFAGDTDMILLVDEAHQLAPRVCGSLSAGLPRAEIRAAMSDAPPAIARALRRIDRQLRELQAAPGAEGGKNTCIERPQKLDTALQAALEAFSEWRREQRLQLYESQYKSLSAAFLSIQRYLRLSEWFDQCAYAFVVEGVGTERMLTARCLDAAAYLQSLWKETGACIRLSATVSPPAIYQASHGILPPGVAAETGDQGPDGAETFARAGSPFAPAQLRVLIVPDIDTRWRQREQSLPALLLLMQNVTAAKPGRYLLCFPSYRYLQQFASIAAISPAGCCPFIAQTPGEDAAILDLLKESEHIVLGIVLGGTLSESVDLTDTPLVGVLVVGVAQSPPSPELDLAAAHFHSRGLDGQLMAYIQPGMSRIVQAAGRLIRNTEHRGVVVLMDPRFLKPAWQQFFPALWRPQTVKADAVGSLVKEFWTSL